MILLTASTLVTAKQYIGDPIDCIVEDVPQGVMDTYCWIHSTFRYLPLILILLSKILYFVTFSVPKAPENPEAHPGVGNDKDEDERRYHKYYQWVCFTLFFQALLFYIPRWVGQFIEPLFT